MSRIIIEKSKEQKLEEYDRIKDREKKYRLRRECKIRLLEEKCKKNNIIITEKEIDELYQKLYK